MKLTTMTQITIDGVVQGNGGATEEDRKNGFYRGAWALGAGDDETRALIIPVVLGQGAPLFPDDGPDLALKLVDSRVDSKGVTIQTFRPNGRPQYPPAR